MRKLSVEAASKGIPARFLAVVTFLDPGTGSLFVQDATAGIFVFLRHSQVTGDLRVGRSVLVEGVSTPGEFCPSITQARIIVGPRASLPIPKRPAMDEVLTGALDSQWAQVRGVVRSAQVVGKYLLVTVNHLGHTFTLTIPDFSSGNWSSLIGSEILATGTVTTRFNERRQLIGVNLDVPSLSFIKITRAAAANPFDLPLSPLASVGQFSTETETRRVRVHGTATAVETNGTLYLSDGEDRVQVQPSGSSCAAKPGDVIEAVGFPASQDFRPTLQNAICRNSGLRFLLTPEQLQPDQVFRNHDDEFAAATRNDMRLVRLHAVLVQILYGERSELLLLSGGGVMFSATLPIGQAGKLVPYEPGSVLGLTGVCLMSYDGLEQGKSFRLLLRSPSDVFVHSHPGWWNARHALWLLALLIAMAISTLIWVYMLRKRVRQQTALIRLRLESESELETRYRNLFQTNLAAVVSFTSESEILDCNPAFARLIGSASRIGLVGTRLVPATVSEQTFEGWIDQVKANGNCRQSGLSLTDGNGHAVWVHASISSDDSSGGVAHCYQAILIDVSVQRRFEDELMEQKNQAEAASRLKGEFLANMSHEIRTPMNAVLGMTSLALSVDISEEVREYLRMAQDAANQLLNLLNDVLDYSKIEAGKLVLEKIEFAPRDVLKRIARMLAVKAHEKGLELVYAVEDTVPRNVIGDSYRLQQLLVNLVGNAIKFTEQGEVSIQVDGKPGNDSQFRLTVQIHDTGIGIEPDRQTGIFEAFTQADGSTTRKHGGTGLGLSICNQLAALMGGHISVLSTPGKGSTFTFDCLLDRATDSEPAHQELGCERLRETRVLILCSNAAVRAVLDRLTAKWGMRPTSASTLQAAQYAFGSAVQQSSPFQLILADREFDSGDGFLALKSLRSETSSPIPAVMMLSSVLIGSDLSRCRKLPLSSYVLKPVDSEELQSSIRQVLGQAEAKATRQPPLASEKQHDRSLRILLAEDNAVNRKLASALLSKAGHSVVTVQNGREAVAEVDKQEFDAVLMDVQMPIMDGFEATASIRRLPVRERSSVPIIALTAHALSGYREQCLAAGMDGYLTKPIDAAKLTKILDQIASPASLAR